MWVAVLFWCHPNRDNFQVLDFSVDNFFFMPALSTGLSVEKKPPLAEVFERMSLQAKLKACAQQMDQASAG